MTGKQPRVDFIELHILHHATERAVYGLWMIEELARHGYRLGPSQFYPKFHRLEKSGLLRRTDKVVEGKVRKYYRTTAAGLRHLRDQKQKLTELAGEALTTDEIRRLLKTRQAQDRRMNRKS